MMESITNLYADSLQIGHCHLGSLACEFNRMKLYTSKHAKCLQKIVRPGNFIFCKVNEHIKGTFID